MENARLDEAQAGIKIARRNINNLRHTDDTILMTRSKELKSLLMKVKEQSEKVGLKLNMASGIITSWQIDGKTVTDFIFYGSKITADGNCSQEIERSLLPGLKVMTKLDSMLKSRDELKSLLMRLKEETAKAGLKLNIHKMKIMASIPITSWQ